MFNDIQPESMKGIIIRGKSNNYINKIRNALDLLSRYDLNHMKIIIYLIKLFILDVIILLIL